MRGVGCWVWPVRGVRDDCVPGGGTALAPATCEERPGVAASSSRRPQLTSVAFHENRYGLQPCHRPPILDRPTVTTTWKVEVRGYFTYKHT